MSVTKSNSTRFNRKTPFNKLKHGNESVLVKKSKEGDRDAFGELYMKYLDPIYRYIFFRVNQNREEAEDLAEIVFFKAWEHIKRYHANGKTIKPWLYTIAHNTIIDHWRRNRRYTRLDPSIEDPNGDFERALSNRGDNEKLFEAVNKLTDGQKQVIILKFIEGLSNKELETILNKRPDAVRALQSRALKQLRKLLTKTYEDS